jgi:hypothetical protein
MVPAMMMTAVTVTVPMPADVQVYARAVPIFPVVTMSMAAVPVTPMPIATARDLLSGRSRRSGGSEIARQAARGGCGSWRCHEANAYRKRGCCDQFLH